MKQPYVIAYDITEDRRLTRICRYLKGKGLHLQKSVFFCILNKEELKEIISELKGMIDPCTDDVRIYPVLGEFKTVALGNNEILPPGVFLHLK
ncbi:MAG: CRISPR-associated endonuclease Cas2 [Candidatus Saccharicenans sp.]|nr:CRISPR-associated endonuclease Cas2 [Candidatus Saccharicenans sp.]